MTFKRFIFIFIFIFILSAFFAVNAAYAISVKESKQEYTQNSRKEYYHIAIIYPQFYSREFKKSARALNRIIYQRITTTVNAFKNSALSNLKWYFEKKAANPQFPLHLTEKSNILFLRYDLFYNAHGIISLRFNKYVYYYGSAHPVKTSFSLNYDLVQNKILELKDLFKPKSNYLHTISKIARQDLAKALVSSKSHVNETDDPRMSIMYHGTKPSSSNFDNWNITAKKLFFTFDPHDVAAFVDGAQYVTIPYSELAKILEPDGVVRRIVQ